MSFLGKAATFNLMYGFPLLLLGAGDSWIARPAEIVSWAFIWWGATLYWWAAILYAVQVRQIIRGRATSSPSTV